MAIAVGGTRRGTGSRNVDGAGASTVPLSSTPTAGCTLLLTMMMNDNTALVTAVSDTRGNAYVQLGNSGNTNTLMRVHVWACLAQQNLANGDLITVQWSVGSASYLFAADEVTGLGGPVDKTATGFSTTNTTAVSTGTTAATAQANELVWVAIGTNALSTDTQTMTPGATYTAQGPRVTTSSGGSLYVEYKVVSSTGTQSATATLVTTATKYAAVLVTVTVAAAGGAGPKRSATELGLLLPW